MIYRFNEHSLRLNKINLENVIELSQLSDVENISMWLNKPIDEINFFIKKEPIDLFKNQISEMEKSYDLFPEEKSRTIEIFNLLKNDGKVMPIFVELNDNDKFILEGRHRIVAFKWFNLKKIFVIYVT